MNLLEKLKKMLADKEARKAELTGKGKTSTDVEEMRVINSELIALGDEISELRAAVDAAEKEAASQAQKTDGGDDAAARTKAVSGEGTEKPEARGAEYVPGQGFRPVDRVDFRGKQAEDDVEKRMMENGEALKESRAVTVGSSDVLLPQHQSTEIGGTFNQVSSLIDAVKHRPLSGGESYRKAYVKDYGVGDYTLEGAAAAQTEPVFGYAEIAKAKVTAYAEETEEIEKLPAAEYARVVQEGVVMALRKKLTREILIGDGSTNHLTGIFNSDTIEASTDLSVDSITTDTLLDILFGYGGDEDVESVAVLILNKKDLAAFARLRTTDGKRYHSITTNGNTGYIDGVPYIINSACGSISDSATAENKYCMAYGPLANYELAVFSATELKKSTDYKFKEGMTSHRGVVFAGGNVVAYNGFLRVKKAAVTA